MKKHYLTRILLLIILLSTILAGCSPPKNGGGQNALIKEILPALSLDEESSIINWEQ